MITAEQILSWNPCEDYDTREKILAVTGGMTDMSPYEEQYPDDNRPRVAIDTKRKWLDGKATDDEMAAAGAAAWAAELEWQLGKIVEVLKSLTE